MYVKKSVMKKLCCMIVLLNAMNCSYAATPPNQSNLEDRQTRAQVVATIASFAHQTAGNRLVLGNPRLGFNFDSSRSSDATRYLRPNSRTNSPATLE